MTDSKLQLKILARRAGFVAAAIASSGTAATGCDNKEPDVTQHEAVTCLSVSTRSAQEDAAPMPCLRPLIAPPTPELELDKDHAYEIRINNVAISCVLRAKVVGGTIPHAAQIAAGRHMQNRVNQCFRKVAPRGEEMNGEVDLTLEVAPDGKVTKASGTAKGKISETLRDCLVDRSKRLGFHPVEGGKTASVEIHMAISKKD